MYKIKGTNQQKGKAWALAAQSRDAAGKWKKWSRGGAQMWEQLPTIRRPCYPSPAPQ